MIEQSPEVQEMEQREKARWLAVAEAERLIRDWEALKVSVDGVVASLPPATDLATATLTVAMVASTFGPFGTALGGAVARVKEMHG